MKKEDEMKHNINEVREADRIDKKEAPNDDEDEYILRAQLLAQISKKMSAKGKPSKKKICNNCYNCPADKMLHFQIAYYDKC